MAGVRAADVAGLYAELRSLWKAEGEALLAASEAQTEERWVRPVLSALGFAYGVQAPLRVGPGWQQPDYALFEDPVAVAAAALPKDPDARAFRERLAEEHAESRDRLLEYRTNLWAAEAEAEDVMADLYELSASQRALIDGEYQRADRLSRLDRAPRPGPE